MRIKELLRSIWNINGKIGIGFGLIAFALLIVMLVSNFLWPEIYSESEITDDRVLAAQGVCKQIPIPDDFIHLGTQWGQRTGSQHDWYSNYYKTSRSFEEVHKFFLDSLPQLEFKGGTWVDSVRERQIVFGKDEVRVMISFRLSYTNHWEFIRDKLSGSVWNIYIDCAHRSPS